MAIPTPTPPAALSSSLRFDARLVAIGLAVRGMIVEALPSLEYWVAAASVTRRAGHELPMRMPTTKTSTPPTMTGMRPQPGPHQLGSFSSGLMVRPCHPAYTRTQNNGANAACVPRYFAPLAVQIISQLVDGELVITNDIFDQIADRDDSDQLSLVNDGKITNSLLGHHRHAFFRS